MKATEDTLQPDGWEPEDVLGSEIAPDALDETFWERYGERVVGVLAVLAFLGLWEALARSGLVNPLFTSSPTLIARAFVKEWQNGTLVKDVSISAYEFIVGYGISIAIGVPLGIAIGWYRPVRAVANPFVMGLYTTPRIALMPLVLIWFGIGLWSKVAIVVLGAVFPLLINMETAMRTIDTDLLKAARSFGASEWDIFRTVALPSSLPYLVSGLRLALGHALIGVVVGELFAATAGVGYRITIAGETFQTDQVFVGVFLLVFAAISMNALLMRIERRLDVWRPSVRG